jgi:hypothetical protein
VGECRYSGGGNVYEAAAQGALLGAQSGDASVPALGCCVGVTVAHNNFSGIDQMGIRVATDYECASTLNQVVFNKVENWGQLSKARGGDLRLRVPVPVLALARAGQQLLIQLLHHAQRLVGRQRHVPGRRRQRHAGARQRLFQRHCWLCHQAQWRAHTTPSPTTW